MPEEVEMRERESRGDSYSTRLGVVRQTTGKVLESMMGTLQPFCVGARVLDLFAGTGTVGLAALDHGAAEAVFVEGHPTLAGQLRRRIPPGSSVVVHRLPLALERITGPFDLILLDPPYGSPDGLPTLLAAEHLLAEDGWMVVEHHHKEPYPDGTEGLELERRKRFGETALSYYRGRNRAKQEV
jgi:16S rRNA (guanine966-N2)-methyltransferase